MLRNIACCATWLIVYGADWLDREWANLCCATWLIVYGPLKSTFLILKKKKVGLWDHVALCVCVCVCIPIVARQRLGKSPLIVARQRLGKNPLVVARQRLGKNPPIVSRLRVGRNVTAVTNTRATVEELLDAFFFQCGPCRIKESRRFVLPRTFCYFREIREIRRMKLASGQREM
jgi:hypothetical protein